MARRLGSPLVSMLAEQHLSVTLYTRKLKPLSKNRLIGDQPPQRFIFITARDSIRILEAKASAVSALSRRMPGMWRKMKRKLILLVLYWSQLTAYKYSTIYLKHERPSNTVGIKA